MPWKDKNKREKKPRLSVGDALQYVKDNKLSPKEAFEYLKKNNSKALMVMNPNRWEMEKKDPNYKPPITKEEHEKYKSFNENMSHIKDLAGDVPLTNYLKQNGYAPHSKSATSVQGKLIVEQAKKRGAKVEDVGNGMYKVYDDETTYRDTDQSYKVPRIIHADTKYARNTFRKGKDLVNVYSVAELPKYGGRVPTPQETEEYQGGKYYTEAATPEMKKYYADVYFDPANPNNEKATTYGSQVSTGDIDRYKYAKQLGEQIKPEYSDWQKKMVRRENFKEKVLPKLIGGAALGAVTGGAIAAPVLTGGLLTAASLLHIGMRSKKNKDGQPLKGDGKEL